MYVNAIQCHLLPSAPALLNIQNREAIQIWEMGYEGEDLDFMMAGAVSSFNYSHSNVWKRHPGSAHTIWKEVSTQHKTVNKSGSQLIGNSQEKVCIKNLSCPWRAAMGWGKQGDAFAKLEFRDSHCLLPFSYIWAGTSTAVLVPRQVVQLVHLIFFQNNLWNGLKIWKTWGGFKVCLFLPTDNVCHFRIWVFLNQNEEEAKWLGNILRFQSAFSPHSLRAGSWQAIFPSVMCLPEWTDTIHHAWDQGLVFLTFSCSVKIKARKAFAWM